MNDQEKRRYEMLTRVRDFGAMHTTDFPASTLGNQLFTTIGTIVTELDAHAANQSSGIRASQQGTTSKAVARDRLRRALEEISRTARSMAFAAPGLDSKFHLPRTRKGGDQELLNAARSFAADAAPLKTEFIRHELPATFLADLDADIESFEQSVTFKHQGTDTHVAATAAIDEAIEGGTNAVRQLDAIIRNKFRDDSATLAAWTSASHTERAPRPKAPAPATT
ncbi:MAG: hypothetical protein ABR577_08060 [Pyrinomonadaceae bacterium]